AAKQVASTSSTGSPAAGCASRARNTVRGGGGWNGWRQRAARRKAPAPDNRISARAARPGGVASATMGSESSLGLRGRTGDRRIAQPPLRNQVLLWDAEQVLRRIVQIQARGEPQEQKRHERGHRVQHHLRLR